MSVVNVQFFSPALNRHVHYNVILPREGTGPFSPRQFQASQA